MKKLLFLLLAVCLISFLTGCDSGGGGSSSGGGGGDGGGGGGSAIYVVTDLADMTGVTNFSIIEGGIQFDRNGHTYKHIVKLSGTDSGSTFSLYQKETEDGALQCDCTYSGTFTVSGSTVNIHCTLTEYTNGDPPSTVPWDDTCTITGEDTIELWDWVLTKQ